MHQCTKSQKNCQNGHKNLGILGAIFPKTSLNVSLYKKLKDCAGRLHSFKDHEAEAKKILRKSAFRAKMTNFITPDTIISIGLNCGMGRFGKPCNRY